MREDASGSFKGVMPLRTVGKTSNLCIFSSFPGLSLSLRAILILVILFVLAVL